MYLPDVQSATDARNLAIQRVGVKSLAHPVMVATSRGPQPSVASVDMTVALPGATTASTGLPDNPRQGGAWIMNAGTSTAHLMVPGE